MSNKDHEKEEHGQDKTYSIIVNGRQREVTERKLTYLQVVQLAYPGEQPSEGVVFTVTFSKPHGKEGSLVEGQDVKIKNRMVFNVNKTDRS